MFFSKPWSKAKGIFSFILTKFSQLLYFFRSISLQAILYFVRGVEPLLGYIRYNFTPLVALVMWQILEVAQPSSSALYYAYRYQKNVIEPFYNSTWMLFLADKMEQAHNYASFIPGDVRLLNLAAALLVAVIGLCIEPIGALCTLGIRAAPILQSTILPLISVYSLMRFVPLKAQYTNILGYQNISEETDFIPIWDTYLKIVISIAAVFMLTVNPFGKTVGYCFKMIVCAHNAVVMATHMRETGAAYQLAFIPLLANLMFTYVYAIRLSPATLRSVSLAKPAIPIFRAACSLGKLTFALPDSGYNSQVDAR